MSVYLKDFHLALLLVQVTIILAMTGMLHLMVERYGSRTTLGEALAVAVTMTRLCRVDRVTLAEIADATGLRKQNLSRWALKRMGQSIELKSNEDDRRIKEIVLIDPDQGQEYVEALARTLGIDTRDR